MSDIKFEDLPPRGKHAAAAAAMKANPGQWAIVSKHRSPSSASASAHLIRVGYLIPYKPAGSFEAWSRTVGEEFRVYARYVGEPKEPQ